MKLKIHPLAKMIPAMSEEEFADLKADIEAFYLRYPDLEPERLIGCLQEKYGSADKLLNAAKQTKTDFYLPNNYEAFGFMARLAYNGTRSGKHTLPEWRA